MTIFVRIFLMGFMFWSGGRSNCSTGGAVNLVLLAFIRQRKERTAE
jgi:hypothetical protein